MEVKVDGLDMSIKDTIRNSIKHALIKKFRTLPINLSIDMLKEVLTIDFKLSMEDKIKNYYQDVSECDIICHISDEDFMDIYLQM